MLRIDGPLGRGGGGIQEVTIGPMGTPPAERTCNHAGVLSSDGYGVVFSCTPEPISPASSRVVKVCSRVDEHRSSANVKVDSERVRVRVRREVAHAQVAVVQNQQNLVCGRS
jgi:hypothetical protein